MRQIPNGESLVRAERVDQAPIKFGIGVLRRRKAGLRPKQVLSLTDGHQEEFLGGETVPLPSHNVHHRLYWELRMSVDLKTARLRLSQVRPEDWEEYYPILSDPKVSEYSDLPRVPTEKRTKGLVNWMVRISQQSKGFGWMVRDGETGVLLGCIRLNSIDRPASGAIIGYEFGTSYWAKGYATETLVAVTKHCHEDMKLYRLEAWTLVGNPASDRVLTKAGFRHEGTQRQKMVIGGQRFDKRLFGRLADD